jgi:hypothetical protein
MKIAIASINDEFIPELKRRLNTDIVFTSSQPDAELKRADIAIQIDEAIFLNDQQIDLVVEILSLDVPIEQLTDDRFLLVDQKLIVFKEDQPSSFACSPEIFSMLGSQYKLTIEDAYINSNVTSVYKNKLFFLANRLGINFHVL